MEKNDKVNFTQEGYKKVLESLKDYPPEVASQLLSMFVMNF